MPSGLRALSELRQGNVISVQLEGPLSSDLNTSKSQPPEDLGARVFQAEGTSSTKALRQKP